MGFPSFGNQSIPRRLHDPDCYMFPGTYDKYAATPCIMDTRPYHATRRDAIDSGSLVVTLPVDAQGTRNNLPLALWDLPREFQPGVNWYHASDNSRFVPIVAPYTGNLNGFLLADVTKGHNVFTLRITSSERPLKTIDFQIGSSLRGKIFPRDGTDGLHLAHRPLAREPPCT